MGPEKTKSKEVGRKTRCTLVTLNFQVRLYISGFIWKDKEKLVKAGWGQIRDTLECKIREWGLYSVSNVESLKASGKERLFRKDRPVSDM